MGCKVTSRRARRSGGCLGARHLLECRLILNAFSYYGAEFADIGHARADLDTTGPIPAGRKQERSFSEAIELSF